MPDLQGIKKARNKGKKKNPGPQDFKKQKVKVGRKLVKKNETLRNKASEFGDYFLKKFLL